jgi:RISC-loading complex subunit TARBP2
MQEVMLEDQMRAQLHIIDPSAVLAQQNPQLQNRQNRPRRVKKQAQPKPPEALEETINNLKNEIEYMPMKTPISILQELLSRRGKIEFLFFHIDFLLNFFSNPRKGITPNYELVQIEGAVHEPSFRYRVSFNDKDGENLSFQMVFAAVTFNPAGPTLQ